MSANRVNDGALGALERPALAWMAQRVPLSITPDHLTLVGLAGAMLAAAGFVASHWSVEWLWLANAGLLINWAGDSLDGNLARLRGIERRRYGFFVDHTSDLFAQVLMFLALGASPCAHFGVAALGLIAFLMMFVYTLICAEVRDTFRITYFGLGPTEIRALLIAGNLITLRAGLLDFGPALLPRAAFTVTHYELVIVVLFVVTIFALPVIALRERRVLALEDPARAPAPNRASVMLHLQR